MRSEFEAGFLTFPHSRLRYTVCVMCVCCTHRLTYIPPLARRAAPSRSDTFADLFLYPISKLNSRQCFCLNGNNPSIIRNCSLDFGRIERTPLETKGREVNYSSKLFLKIETLKSTFSSLFRIFIPPAGSNKYMEEKHAWKKKEKNRVARK